MTRESRVPAAVTSRVAAAVTSRVLAAVAAGGIVLAGIALASTRPATGRSWISGSPELQSPGSDEEPIEWRLLRTLQIGKPQGTDVDEMLEFANGNDADFTGHLLARAALTVIGEDRGFPDWPLDRLLARVLTQLQRGASSAYSLPEELHGGFRGEHLVLAMVYAMVVSGQEEAATDVLEAGLETGSDFKRGVALQALRSIGTERATGIVQRAADEDRSTLAANLLADYYYPFLHELYDHWELIPLAERDREKLTTTAAADCGLEASVAVYLLGFFAPATDAAQERRELDALRRVTRLGRQCYYNRFFAIRSLAMRSPETIDFWVDLYRGESDAWQRAQLVRIGFARFGRDFLDAALELLADEPAQYVQWELMHGNIELREGAVWRSYWDIWLTPTLQFRLDFAEGQGSMSATDLDDLLTWLETGAHAQDPWVRNHMLYGLARHVDGERTRRFLRIFDAHPEKAANWWILDPLTDPLPLPLLRYWQTLDTDDQQRESLARTIRGLESPLSSGSGSAGSAASGSAARCCEPTRECLLTAIDDAASPDAAANFVIETEEQAQAWLRGASFQVAAPGPQVTFLDSLERVALVTWADQDRGERWEHLFGCWRRVDRR